MHRMAKMRKSGIPCVPRCGKDNLTQDGNILFLVSLFTMFSCKKRIIQYRGYIGQLGCSSSYYRANSEKTAKAETPKVSIRFPL